MDVSIKTMVTCSSSRRRRSRSNKRASGRLYSMASFAIMLLLLLHQIAVCSSFQTSSRPAYIHRHKLKDVSTLSLSQENSDNNNKEQQFSRQVMLREEAESPFRKVRFFLYATLSGGALISLAVSGTRVLAALTGINVDLMEESLTNVLVDVTGLIVMGFLYQRDLQAQDSRRKRASRGAELAKLLIRASARLKDPLLEATSVNDLSFTTSLASLRRGRGIEKRVVIAVGGPDKIDQVLQDAKRLDSVFLKTDLVLVPVIASTGAAPDVSNDESLAECVALPFGNGWKNVIADELQEAASQGVDIESNGFCIVLKKNGRVGQRTSGIPLMQMVGDVEQRQASGLDVKNI